VTTIIGFVYLPFFSAVISLQARSIKRNAWSMKQRVPDKRGPGERLWKRTVKHVD